MFERELTRLLRQEIAGPIYVGRIDPAFSAHIGARTGQVWLSYASAAHVLTEHGEIKFEHLLMLPIAIKFGALLLSQHRKIFVQYTDEAIFGSGFRATVKTTGDGQEMYVASFHKERASETRRYRKRNKLLREME